MTKTKLTVTFNPIPQFTEFSFPFPKPAIYGNLILWWINLGPPGLIGGNIFSVIFVCGYCLWFLFLTLLDAVYQLAQDGSHVSME